MSRRTSKDEGGCQLLKWDASILEGWLSEKELGLLEVSETRFPGSATVDCREV